jgi:hypothetical protein
MGATYSPHDETRRGNQNLRDQNPSVASRTLTVAQPRSKENHRANSSPAVTYRVVLLLFLFLGVLIWTRWDFSAQEIPDWKPALALADTARKRGDLYYAKSLYAQAGRLSARRNEWAGLLAVACGMKKLERQRGRHSETNALLLGAMVAAKTKQSRSGLVAVAKAFTALGQDKVASMVLSHSGKDWVEEANNSADPVSLDCWDQQA